MLKVLQMRMGKSKDATVVVDPGMSNPENLAEHPGMRAITGWWPHLNRSGVCYFEQLRAERLPRDRP